MKTVRIFVFIAIFGASSSVPLFANAQNLPRPPAAKKQAKKVDKNPRKVTFKKPATTAASAKKVRPNSRVPNRAIKPSPQQFAKNINLKNARFGTSKHMSKPRPLPPMRAGATSVRPVTSTQPLKSLSPKPQANKKTSWFSSLFGGVNFYKSAKKKR